MFRTGIVIICAVALLAGCGNGGEAQPVAADEQAAQVKPAPPPPPPPPPEPIVKGELKTREVALLETKGEIDEVKVNDVIGKRMGAIQGCYESALKGDPKLTGKLVVRFVIGPDGKVSEAAIPQSELPQSVGDCVAQAFKGFRFPPPKDGAVTLESPFLFSPAEGEAKDKAESPVASTNRREAAVIGGKGAIDTSQVNAVVTSNVNKALGCYEQALRQDPKVTGRVIVRVTVEAEGAVSAAETILNELPPQVGACIVDAFKTLTFPKPTGGAATLEIPFLFEPSQQ